MHVFEGKQGGERGRQEEESTKMLCLSIYLNPKMRIVSFDEHFSQRWF